MVRIITVASAVVLAALVSACAPQPHTEEGMTAGSHNMPGLPKPGVMSNQAMPERSSYCTPERLATMPPEHREYCLRGR
jgi:hypothetical protein